MSNPHAALEISIIGGRLGESIVIRTPGGNFGVIDSYTSEWTDPDQNPTLARLKDLGAAKLRFVALTHPHMDHYRGLPSIFQAYSGRIEEFWRPPIGGQDWREFIAQFLQELDEEPDDQLRQQKGWGGWIFRVLLDRAQAERNAGTMGRQIMVNDGKQRNGGNLFEEVEHDFSIWCLGPSSDTAQSYTESIIRKNLGRLLNGTPPTPNAEHNDISAVLAIKYGTWVGIFGGDTERSSWLDILERRREKVASARFFKVSHHGSPTGSFEDLWASVTTDSCAAVVTCYAHQRLPKEEGLKYLLDPPFWLYSTNRNLAQAMYRDKSEDPVPVEFEVDKTPGEIRLTVDRAGQVRIDHFDPAGLVEV